MFINNLSNSRRELKSFITYVSAKTNINDFIKLDFKFQLGWYLEYLNACNIIIVTNRNSYRIYYAKSNAVKRKTFKDTDYMKILETAIVDAFAYIENPF